MIKDGQVGAISIPSPAGISNQMQDQVMAFGRAKILSFCHYDVVHGQPTVLPDKPRSGFFF